MLGRIVGSVSRRCLAGGAKIVGKGPVVGLMKRLNSGMRRFSSATHNLQMFAEWNIPPAPEWFDHYIDQHDQWSRTGNPLWVERGCFGLLAIKPRGRVLELCCGDGFNARHFYAIQAGGIIACDFDPTAVTHASRYNAAPNVEFRVADIRTEMPEGEFDNIVWDAAIEHFTEEEIDSILSAIRARLKPGGVLGGYTLVERADQVKHLEHHEYEFKSKEDLLRFFEPHFANVTVFETVYPTRHNLYFWASDGEIPFGEKWSAQAGKRA